MTQWRLSYERGHSADVGRSPAGEGFGAIASLWGIGNPETIIRAARLIDRLLPACFLLVTALGSVLLYGLHASGVAMHFSPKPTYIYGVVLGGILFGVGLALSGYLPGTALMAIGEGRRDALLAIPGGLLGASAWTALADTDFGPMDRLRRELRRRGSRRQHT